MIRGRAVGYWSLLPSESYMSRALLGGISRAWLRGVLGAALLASAAAKFAWPMDYSRSQLGHYTTLAAGLEVMLACLILTPWARYACWGIIALAGAGILAAMS